MAFAQGGKCLIAVGVAQEGSLALFDVTEGIIVKSTLIREHAVNKIIVDPNLDEGLEFITVGSKGCFIWWKAEVEEDSPLELTF